MNYWDWKVTLSVQAIVDAETKEEREELFEELLTYLETPGQLLKVVGTNE